MASESVKSCPFCGEYPSIRPWHGGGPRKRVVVCEGVDCFVTPMVSGSTKQRAIAKWNHRAQGAQEG